MRVALLGIPVDMLDTAEALERIFELISTPSTEGCRILATLNVDFIVNALSFGPHRCKPGLLEVLREATMVTPDGMPLVLLSRLLGCPLPERVTGADLVPLIAQKAADTGKKLYFLGGEPDATKEAAELLTARHPGLQIVGIDTPFVKLDHTEETIAQNIAICDKINAAAPDLLLIAFGNPKQELWLAANVARLNIPAAIGIGGSFNFLCGRVRRAPRWMQVSGLEWIYRIIQEPKRLWKRYLLGFFVFNALSALAISATALGVPLRPFSGNAVRRNTADSIELDCKGVFFAGNSFRMCFLDAWLHARRNQLELRTVNANWLLRLQMAAHRLI